MFTQDLGGGQLRALDRASRRNEPDIAHIDLCSRPTARHLGAIDRHVAAELRATPNIQIGALALLMSAISIS